MSAILLSAIFLVSICALTLSLYIFIKYLSFRLKGSGQGIVDFSKTTGFGRIQNDGAEIAEFLVKKTKDFTFLTESMLRFQKKIQNFCMHQSEEIQLNAKRWQLCMNLLIELTDVIQLTITKNDSSVAVLESLMRRLKRGYEDIGVMVIDPKDGDFFSPDVHRMLDSRHSDQPQDSILETIHPGYALVINKEIRIIRPAEVVLSLGKAPVVPEEEDFKKTAESAEDEISENISETAPEKSIDGPTSSIDSYREPVVVKIEESTVSNKEENNTD